MPKYYRAQCAIALDSILPRDRVTVNPCFRDGSGGEDLVAACTELANGIDSIIVGTQEVKVSLYDVTAPKPNPPAATYTKNAGTFSTSSMARELALCLSFYSGVNAPRSRGRLFIPAQWLGVSSPGVRPSAAAQNQVMLWGPMLADIGTTNFEWIVWSKTNNAALPVTNYFCDDEWDVVRSRGLRPTGRVAATTSG